MLELKLVAEIIITFRYNVDLVKKAKKYQLLPIRGQLFESPYTHIIYYLGCVKILSKLLTLHRETDVVESLTKSLLSASPLSHGRGTFFNTFYYL